MAASPRPDSISRHSAPPVSVNLGTHHQCLEIRASFCTILSLHATIRSVMHQPLSDFATHLRKCVHRTNTSSKAQLNRPMRLMPSVRRQNSPGLLGHLLRFCQHRPDAVGVVESSGVFGKRPVPPELRPAAQPHSCTSTCSLPHLSNWTVGRAPIRTMTSCGTRARVTATWLSSWTRVSSGASTARYTTNRSRLVTRKPPPRSEIIPTFGSPGSARVLPNEEKDPRCFHLQIAGPHRTP